MVGQVVGRDLGASKNVFIINKITESFDSCLFRCL